MLIGGLLAGGYIYVVLAEALSSGIASLKAPPQKSRETTALILAVVAVRIGFVPPDFYAFLQLGREAGMGALP
jgi:multicomponent Na+:H+ antiporter subunit D